MKKILTLSISLMLVIGIVSLAKSSDIDTVWNTFATSYCKDRHMVMASDGTIAVLYYNNGKIRAKRSIDFGATWTNLAGGTGFTIIEEGDYIEDGEGGYWTVDRDYSVCRGAGDDIYVAYDKEGHIYFKKLTYSAVSRTWAMSGARVVCNWYTARNPSIIRANNGNVWVAFATEMSGAWGLDSVYSPDEFELTRYEQTVLWGWGAGGPYFPVLVIRNGNPFLVYQDGSTSNMKWSYWNEAVWSTPEIIPLDGEMGDAPWFSVAMLGNDVHLACDAGYGVRAESINMAHTYYNGAWQPGQTISHWIWDKQPSLTTSNGELWCFISTYDNNVAYKKWSGGTWDADWTAVTTTGADYYPTTLLSSPSFIPVAWTCDAEGKVKFTIVGVAPPPAPGNVDDQVAGWSSDNTPTFTWDVPLDPSGIAGYWWAVDNPTPEIGGAWTTAKTATTAPLADGIHTFYVAAQNGLGLIGYAGSHECWIDATDPGAPTGVTATPSGWTSTNSFSVDWTNPADTSGIQGAYYKLDSVPTSDEDGTWTTSKPIDGITVSGDGAHPIYIWLKDNAGNVNYVNRGTTTLYLDTTRPETSITRGPANPTNSTSATFVYSASESGCEFSYRLDGGVWSVYSSTTTTSYAGLPEASHTFEVTARDRAGNVDSSPATYTWVIDTTVPANPTLVLSDQTSGSTMFTNSQIVNVVVGNDADAVAWLISETQSSQPAPGDPRWGIEPVTFNLSAANGLKTVYIWVKDAAGNIDTGPVSATITLDTQIPADPTLVLSDQTTGDTSYTNSPIVNVAVGNDSGVVAWLISETQSSQPAENDPRWGSEPATFNLSAGNGLKRVYIWVKDRAGNIDTGPVSATITLDTQVPADPTLVLRDQTSGSTLYTNSPIVDVTVGNDGDAVAWLISESQSTRPAEGDPRWGIEPVTFTLSAGNGLKRVYIWVKDSAGNIDTGPVSATITLDTQIPADPTLVLSDQTTGDTSYTNSAIVNVVVGNDSGVSAWLINESQSIQPAENDPGWGIEPVTFTLSAGNGLKRVYIWVKDVAGNIDTGPVSATITLDMQIPADPTLVLSDQTTGDTSYTNSAIVNVAVGNDSGVVAWLISETQSSQPLENDSRWGIEPVTFTLSIGDGLKTVYIWVKNGAGNINTGPVSATITLDTVRPADPTLVLRDQTSGSIAYTNSQTVDVQVGNDIDASAWLISESQSTRPAEGDPRWGIEPVTFTLSIGDGLKRVYIWVKDAAGNINIGPISTTIILDMQIPVDPTLVLSDQTTGDTSYTNSPIVNVVVGNDSGVSAWLISESQSIQPAENDPGWGIEPVTFALSAGSGLKRVYIWVKDAAGNIDTGPVSATITLDTQIPADPTLVLSDQTTGDTSYTNSAIVNVAVGNDSGVVAWLISETQSTQPPENDSRWGIEPVTFTLSAGDGLKRVYIWVKNGAGNINTGPVSATITLDTIAPVNPTLVLSDQTSGSTMFTNSQIVNVVVGNDADAVAWLISETQSTQPAENNPGWVNIEPVTFNLSAVDGLKKVYIWVKDAAGNIDTGPVSATITLDTIAPADPTLVLSDQTTGDTSYTNSSIVNVVVGNDSGVSAWLISESQSSQPPENDPRWGIEPVTFTLSAGNGLKRVYIWVKDATGNINTGPVSATITLDMQIPADPTLVLSDQTTGSTTYTNSRTVNVVVGNDSGVVAWLISESQSSQPPENDPRWGIEPVTFTLSAGNGLKRVYIWVKNGTGNINTGPVSATITLDTQIPADPTLVLRDQTSGSTTYTNSTTVDVEVLNDSDAVAWLISESQSVQPAENDSRWGSEPATFTLSIGDGLKRVYIWVKDAAGNINTGPVSGTITLDTQIPADPTLVLRDRTTGSTEYTDEQLVNVEVGNDSGVSAWLISETQSTQPAEDDSRWGGKPATFNLTAEDGSKTVYIWVKDRADNINIGPVSARITLDATPPDRPQVTSMTHPDQSTWYADNDPEFQWICDDPVSGISGYSYLLDQNSGTIPLDISMGTGTSTTYFDVADGTWYFHVKARNGSGLWGGTAHYKVNIGAGYTVYRITSTVTSARTIDPFKLIVELVDPLTGQPKSDANNSFNLNACTVDFKDAPGEWSTGDPLVLNNGRAEIWVTYDTVGTILFGVRDNLGNSPGYTQPIEIRPDGLRYELSAPARAEAGKEFLLTVKLVDTGAGNVVAPAKYARWVRLVAYSSPVGETLAEGELKEKKVKLQGGTIIVPQSYNLAQKIYIEGFDAGQYDPQSVTLIRVGIEVIGAPKTALRLDGIYNEMNAALYVRPTTRVIIESVSDIVAETILYRDKDGDWNTYAEPFTLSPGSHSIEYYGIDKYGHKEGINRSKPIYVSFFGSGEVSNRPNPFKAGREPTLIEYNLKEPSNVIITIYDIFGQEVWHERYEAGENGGRKDNSVPWDGRNLSGKVVANGGYICRVWIEKEKRHMVRKIAVAK